ncbi:MAG: POTRA domain-containing protein, partial [Pseudomonadales bacterium]
ANVSELEPYRGQIIEEIRLAGNRVTRDYVITREIWTEEGKPLDPELVAEALDRTLRSERTTMHIAEQDGFSGWFSLG